MSPGDLLAAALDHVRSGRRVFPLGVRSKRPIRSTADGGHGVHDATADEAQVTTWWTTQPRANIGIACGPDSDLLVIDVDGPVGREALGALEGEHGALPRTRRVRSGREDGGEHLWFRWPKELVAARGKLGRKIDVLGPGRYVVAPPSVHPSGRRYEADAAPIADAPKWLVAAITKEQPTRRPRLQVVRSPHDEAVRRARAYVTTIPGAVSGERGHDATFHVACVLVEGFDLSIDEARPLLLEWNERCRPPWSEPQLEHKLVDALAQVSRPGYLLAEDKPVTSGDEHASDAASRAPLQTPSAVPGEELCTDMGNARRLALRAGEDLRHTASHGWIVWDGRRWRRDETGRVMGYAKAAVRAIFDEAKAAGATARAQELASWAVKSQKRERVTAMLDLAASEPEIATAADVFDRDPWLLCVRNGTVDLRTGVLRPHRRGDLITRLAPCDYDPSSVAPTWDAFLERVQPDPQVRSFLQRLVGCGLTGDVGEEVFTTFFGSGANGKSKFVETVMAVMGDYAKSTPFDTFTSKRTGSTPSNDLAALAGARFVVASEPPDGVQLNVALVKHATGGDTITARFLHKEFFSFRPAFKPVLVTNFKPRIPDATDAIWRRVLLVDFPVVIPPQERDKKLLAKLLAEAAGILAWAVRGCLAWRARGLQPPPSVVAATEEFRVEEDPFGRFFAQCCQFESRARTTSGDLWARYGGWCRENGEEPRRINDLAGALQRRGCRRDKSLGQRCWIGLRLAAPDTLDTSDTSFSVNPFTRDTEEETRKELSSGVRGVQEVGRQPGEEG